MKASKGILHRNRRRLVWTTALIWTAAFVATHVPTKELPALIGTDKVLHAIGYAVLAGALLMTLTAYRVAPLRRIPFVIAVSVIYAGLDELTQPLVNRSAELGDWLADLTGAAAAVILWEVAQAMRRPAHKTSR